MTEHFETLDDVEAAMTQALRDAQLAKAQGQPAEELQHMAAASRLANLRDAVDAYGSDILLSEEAH